MIIRQGARFSASQVGGTREEDFLPDIAKGNNDAITTYFRCFLFPIRKGRPEPFLSKMIQILFVEMLFTFSIAALA